MTHRAHTLKMNLPPKIVLASDLRLSIIDKQCTTNLKKLSGNKNSFFHPNDPQGITQGGLPGIPTQL